MSAAVPLPAGRSPQLREPLAGVLLDVNETLFALNGLVPAFEAVGVAADRMPLWFARVLRDGFALAAAGDFATFADVARAALLGLDPSRLTIADADTVLAAFHGLQPHPDVAAGLADLTAAGIRVMTLTVGDVGLVRALFERAGLAGHVHAYLSADAVRRWKPAREAYEYGVAGIGLPADRVALIAAHSWDIHGAALAGLRTGFLTRIEAHPSPVFRAADVTGATLSEVVARLLATPAEHTRPGFGPGPTIGMEP
jgi:2-haloacid dehalogenase